jgi:hypothetical protein
MVRGGQLNGRRIGARAAIALLAAAAMLLVPARPASATTSWVSKDITIRAVGAPAAAQDGLVLAFSSDISGEGPVGRVIYRSTDGHVNQLKVDASGWQWLDLTKYLWNRVPSSRTAALLADDLPFGYITNLDNQGAVARIIYKSGGHVQELSFGSDHNWRWADLNDITGAPAVADNAIPVGYQSNLCGQGPVARVIYRSADNHIQELSVSAKFAWRRANPDLTSRTGAVPAVNAFPIGYTTNLAGQGPVARVVYESADHHIHELSLPSDCQWHRAVPDLTTKTGAPTVNNGIHAYVTDLTGQGQVARVVYTSSDNHVQELSVGSDHTWRNADLSARALWPIPPPPLGKIPAAEFPVGYTTNLSGQGPVARVVFRAYSTGHVWELSVGSDNTWRGADLTNLTGGMPPASVEPFGYATNLNGQGPAARVVFRDGFGDIRELSVS